ncbi:serine protease HTRA1-like isoform X2 [Penaeus japonicus]|uniref:serine protease HTRA1-like isoform X2 n=1 Tax=Penaeus japonicus TaxID=27405 RepID=UPI001C70ED73|nr:serine protease HTRA1-like isoform X2 [Penaeus japonicus]
MKTLLLLILLLGVIALSSGTVYSCPKKCPEKCPPLDETSCEHGVVTDACKCCNVCGKGPGEVCNGISLKCGDGMYCDGDALKALYPCCYGLCVAKAVTSALKAVTSAAKPSILYNVRLPLALCHLSSLFVCEWPGHRL